MNRNKWTLNKKKLLMIDLLLAVALVAFDQWTKYLAVAHLKGKNAIVLIKGVFELRYLENRGAAFGLFQNQKVFLVAVAVVFISLIMVFLWKLPDNRRMTPLHILSSMIVAGGVGNMIDRISQEYVVDFFYFSLIDFPIFNVADCYVVVAAILVLILVLFVYKDEDLTATGKRKSSDG